MQTGHFYFISDEFFSKYDRDKLLMKNSEGVHSRPCFYAFPDRQRPYIFWCIPISSQIEKYENIVQRKLQRQMDRGVRKPKCNTIRFGDVMGQRRAFLIQNMFPVTEEYITEPYIDRNTKNPVTVDPKTERDVCTNAKDVLKLVMRGYRQLIFPNIMEMVQQLAADYQQQHTQNDFGLKNAMAKLNPVEQEQKSVVRKDEDWTY